MKLYGLQKMTLLDFPGHVACTVFLNACDFRCPFCHNFELIDGTAPAVMGEDDFFSFLDKRTGLLDGVAITGGEPCLHADLPAFMQKIRARDFAVKLDTNGFHPQILSRILGEGLADYIAMDLKNSPAKYARTCGLEQVDMKPIEESISLLINGDTDYEFRTTVVRELHETSDFEAIGEMIRGAKRYFLQKFTDRDTVPFGNLTAPTREEMEKYASIVASCVDQVALRGVD